MLAQVMSTGASVVLFLVMIPIYAAGVGDKPIGYIALAPLIGLLFVVLIKWDPIGKDVEVAPRGTEAGRAESVPFT